MSRLIVLNKTPEDRLSSTGEKMYQTDSRKSCVTGSVDVIHKILHSYPEGETDTVLLFEGKDISRSSAKNQSRTLFSSHVNRIFNTK